MTPEKAVELFKREKFSPEEIKDLIADIGPDSDGHDFEKDGENWDDSVLQGYADYIRNYLYTYKQMAKNIDPTIDPEQEQIGPMAQDIEKVNPACIKETENGTKTVDTGRLALMNAGAIADLVRRLDSLEGLLKEKGVV